MAKELENAIKLRAAARGYLTRAIKALEAVIQDEDSDRFVYQNGLEELNKRIDALDEAQTQVEIVIEDTKLSDDMEEHALNYYEPAVKLRTDATRNLTKLIAEEDDKKTTKSSEHNASTKPNVKLPKLVLPKFSGAITEWTSWWDQFKVSVDDSELPEVSKMTYLQNLLEGEAKSAIEGLTVTADHYAIAKDLLQQRFGRRELIIFRHIQALIELKAPDTCKDNLSKLKSIQDQVNIRVRSLEALKVDGKESGLFLTPLILSRLPADVRMEWAREGEGKEDDLQNLQEFIKREIERRERANTFKVDSSDSSKEEKKQNRNSSKKGKPKPSTASALHSNSKTGKQAPDQCAFCAKTNHKSSKCWTAKKLSTDDQRAALTKAKLCFRCFEPGHMSKLCKAVCEFCNGKHHKNFCSKQSDSKESKEKSEESQPHDDSVNISCLAKTKQQQVLLQTARIKVKASKGQTVTANVLFDSGSDQSYVSTSLSRKLQLKEVDKVHHRYASFGGNKSSTTVKSVREVLLLDNRNEAHAMSAIEVPTICSMLEKPSISDDTLKGLHVSVSQCAAPTQAQTLSIDILVGLDYYWDFFTGQVRRMHGQSIVAQNSIFGWVLSGKTNENTLQKTSTQLLVLNDLSENEIRRFWDLEHIGIKEETETDDHVYKEFLETVKYDDTDGRYRVSLPWKRDYSSELKNNKAQALNRLRKQYGRMANQPELLQSYHKVFEEWEEYGFIEEVQENELEPTDGTVFYLPHRPVVREDHTSTKVRPVFDGSAKDENGLSLNDCLHTGPKLQPNLVDILMRFRQHKIGLTADVVKAFLQIKLADKDKDSTRFLLMDSDKVRVMRFNRLPFGLNCSPFLLNATIKNHLSIYEGKAAAQELAENLYVDDLLTGSDLQNHATELYNETNAIMNDAGMTMSKWHSNQREIADRDCCIAQESTKVLGIQWDPDSDAFKFQGIDIPSTLVITKRLLLSCIARIFDPLGFIQPYVILAKIMFQDVWRLGATWDEELPQEISREFKVWLSGLQQIKLWSIPRRYAQLELSAAEKKLHVFCDASPRAYGAVVYLETADGLSYVISRSKVSPLKKITLPRLELLACCVGATLLKQVQSALSLKDVTYKCWSDSQIALSWIRGQPWKWKQFVANRVQAIQQNTDPAQWNHCPSQSNPADLITRGISAEDLMASELWLHGPAKLPCNTDIDIGETGIEETDSEEATETLETETFKTVTATEDIDPVFKIARWSRFLKAIRVAAWVLRFCSLCRRKPETPRGELTHEEIEQGKILLIIQDQKCAFPEEIETLAKNNSLSRLSKLYHLNPFLDDKAVLRVRGRIQNSELTYGEKHPIILGKSWFAKLLIRSEHKDSKHAGVSTLLTVIRNQYWIMDMRRIAKSIVKDCVPCQRLLSRPCNQIGAPLPASRVQKQLPFQHTGIDYAGPLYCSDFPGEKFYICLFTCAIVRAVHLELTESLSAEEFVSTFRKFAGRRGLPSLVQSDNAKTFLGAQSMLRSIYGSNCPKWTFITPRAPWHGGYWERMVRNVKNALKRTIQGNALTKRELETTLIEIEYVINSRPLTIVADELDAKSPLTPNHFLLMRDENPSQEVADIKGLAIGQQKMLKLFWKQWADDYIRNLPHLVPQFEERGQLKVNSVVLIQDENRPRLQWPLGRIIRVFPDTDGRIRSVRLKTATGELTRPVQRLHLLEMVQSEEPCTSAPASQKVLESPPLTSKDKVATIKQKKKEAVEPQKSKEDEKSLTTRSGRAVKKRRVLDL